MSKKNTRKEKLNVDDKRSIRGAFVLCGRFVQDEVRGVFLIKLSSINTICPFKDRDDQCFFYTYKDCCYVTDLHADDLRRAVDSFIFNPETHWECYGY